MGYAWKNILMLIQGSPTSMPSIPEGEASKLCVPAFWLVCVFLGSIYMSVVTIAEYGALSNQVAGGEDASKKINKFNLINARPIYD